MGCYGVTNASRGRGRFGGLSTVSAAKMLQLDARESGRHALCYPFPEIRRLRSRLIAACSAASTWAATSSCIPERPAVRDVVERVHRETDSTTEGAGAGRYRARMNSRSADDKFPRSPRR